MGNFNIEGLHPSCYHGSDCCEDSCGPVYVHQAADVAAAPGNPAGWQGTGEVISSTRYDFSGAEGAGLPGDLLPPANRPEQARQTAKDRIVLAAMRLGAAVVYGLRSDEF